MTDREAILVRLARAEARLEREHHSRGPLLRLRSAYDEYEAAVEEAWAVWTPAAAQAIREEE